MNRFDEIQGAARDLAGRVCSDPADRNRLADDLIRLVTFVVAAVGKSVAVDGEATMNDPFSEDEAAHARYITGESIQTAAEYVRSESMGADLERFGDIPDDAPCVCVPVPAYGPDGKAYGFHKCPHERRAVAASFPPVPVPGESFTTPVTVRHPLRLCDPQGCPAHGDAGRIGPCVKDGDIPGHVWVTAEEGDPDVLTEWLCNNCRTPRCEWIPGDAAPACDHSSGCATHGLPSARHCHGASARCVGCGENASVGQHGPSQGFGGCV